MGFTMCTRIQLVHSLVHSRERIGDKRNWRKRTGNSGFGAEGANLLVRTSVYPALSLPQSSRLPGQFPRKIRSPR